MRLLTKEGSTISPVLSKFVGHAVLVALVVGVSAVVAMTPYGRAGLQMPFT